MTLLHTLIHPALTSIDGAATERIAVRAIALQGADILVLYTRRYNDFSFPGGGLNSGEDPVAGLERELFEETGARNIRIVRHYGYVDEYRPHHGPESSLLYMRSHFFVCEVDRELGATRMESYETANGMVPRWMPIHAAIAHNERVMADKEQSMGMSIQRETIMLKHVASDLLPAVQGQSS